MPVVKFVVSDEDFEKLRGMAEKEGETMQDYLRSRLLNVKTIFTPAEAVKRALAKFKTGDVFTLPMIYGDEWTLSSGHAGVLGRQFYKYVQERYSEKFKFEKISKRNIAGYTVL